jgi:hypothetical protein
MRVGTLGNTAFAVVFIKLAKYSRVPAGIAGLGVNVPTSTAFIYTVTFVPSNAIAVSLKFTAGTDITVFVVPDVYE